MNVRDVVEHDARDRLGAQVGDRIGFGEVLELGVLGLQRPTNECREPGRARLDLAHAEQVLDAVGRGLAQTVHHRDRRLQSQPVCRLHHLEPAVGPGLFLRHAVADLLHQDLAAAAGNRVEASRDQLADHRFERHPEPPGEEVDLGRRETVNVDRVVPLDVAQQIQVPRERDVGVVAALDQNLHTAQRAQLVDLPADLLEGEHVALGVLGAAVERAELAVGDADVGVVDVAVDDVGDGVLGVEAPPCLIGERPQLEQRGPLV